MAATSGKAKAGRFPRKNRGDAAKATRSKNGTELTASHEEVVQITTTQTVVIRGTSIKTKGVRTGMLKVAERVKCGSSTAPTPSVTGSKRMKGEAAKRKNEKKSHDAPIKKGPGKRKAEGHAEGDGSTRGRKSHDPAPGIKGSKCTKGEKAVKRTTGMQPRDPSVEMKGHRMVAEKESAKGAKKKQRGQNPTPAPSLKSSKCTKEKKCMKKKDVHSAPTKSLEQQKVEKRTKGAESRQRVHSSASMPCRAEGSKIMKGEKAAKCKNRKAPPNTSAPTSSVMTLHARGARSRQQKQSLNPEPAILHWSPITLGPEEKTTADQVPHDTTTKAKGPRGEGHVKGARGGQGRQRLPSVTGTDLRPLRDCAYFMQGSDHDCAKGEKVGDAHSNVHNLCIVPYIYITHAHHSFIVCIHRKHRVSSTTNPNVQYRCT